jgi:hypothetical protein
MSSDVFVTYLPGRSASTCHPEQPMFSRQKVCRVAFGLILGLIILLRAEVEAAPNVEGSPQELGVRYWLSTGKTAWNHTSGVASLGDPTSILKYEELEAHSLELYFKRFFIRRWFVRGEVGIGWIRDGSLDDEDYFSGQIKFSDTTSTVAGNDLQHVTIDVGRVLFEPAASRLQTYLFAGYQYWAERQDAYGLVYTTNLFGDANLGANVPVISNEARWNSLRVGVGGRYRTSHYTLSANVAVVPYTDLHNRDFHYLRSDLGGVPNIYMNGTGHGWQVDAEVLREFSRNWEIGVGIRYWRLEGDGTIHFGTRPDPSRLNHFESQRAGITAKLVWRY